MALRHFAGAVKAEDVHTGGQTTKICYWKVALEAEVCPGLPLLARHPYVPLGFSNRQMLIFVDPGSGSTHNS